MPAIDPKKLKRLLISTLLVPFAMKRRLSPAQLADLVERAMSDKRFDLSASSDEFANYYLDEAEASDWAEEFERSKTAPHIFPIEGQEQKPEEMYGGVKMSDFLKMPAEQRLATANRLEAERAKKT